MKKQSVLDVTMRICFLITVFFMLSIGIRFLTRQILIERLGWNNIFIKLVFWGDESMGEAPGIPNENGEVLVEIDWEEMYPFSEEEQVVAGFNKRGSVFDTYEALIMDIETKIENYTSNRLLGHMQLTRIGKQYNRLIGCEAMPLNSGNESVIILNNGYMTYSEPLLEKEELEILADNVASFAEYLRDKGICFVYANAGSKVCPTDSQLPIGAVEHTNENADNLLDLLEEREVETLDYREAQLLKYPDWYDSYYITDHHWKTTTGLWAAGVLAEYLNHHAGFQFDLKLFEEQQYVIETKEDYFLGGQGRMLTTAVAEPEAFTTIIPRFPTKLSIQIPSRGVDTTGTYEEVLFQQEFYDKIAEYSLSDFESKRDTYHSAMWTNDALGTVQNHLETNNDGKRILMIQDSFGWYLSTYLALDVSEIDFLNLNTFTGSLQTYIEETKPDAVVLLLCERNIRAIEEAEYAKHTHFFDFR